MEMTVYREAKGNMTEAGSGEHGFDETASLEHFAQSLLAPLSPYTIEAMLARLCKLFGARAVVFHPLAVALPNTAITYPPLTARESLLPAEVMARILHNRANQPYLGVSLDEAPPAINRTMHEVGATYCWLHFREEFSLSSAHYMEIHFAQRPQHTGTLALAAGLSLLRLIALPGSSSSTHSIASSEEAATNTPPAFGRTERVARFGRWIWDIASNHTWFSEGMYALYGREPDLGAPREDWMENIHPEDRSAIMAAMQRAFVSGEYSVDYRLRREDNGEWICLHSDALVEFTPQGQPARMVGVAYDVTRARAAELLLRQDRDLLRGITESCPLAITLLSPTGEIIYANPGAERVLGISQEEIQSRRYNTPAWRHTTVDGAPLPDDEMPFSVMLRTRQPVHGLKHGIEWPDGRRHILSIDGAPVMGPDGELESLVFVVEDVTRQMEAERALRESELRFRQLVEMAPYGIVLTWENGTIVSVNHATELMLATHRSVLAGTPATDWFHCKDTEELSTRFNLANTRGMSVSTTGLDVYVNRGSAPPMPVELMLAPLQIGGMRYIIVAVADLSEQRRIQDEQRELDHQRQVFQKMEGLGRLAGGIAHDINNLIHAIQCVVELVLSRDTLSQQSRLDLEEALHACDRGGEIVGQLLAFARRPASGNRQADLGMTVRDFLPLLKRAVGESITLELHDHLKHPVLIGERGDVEQVLLNLCVNGRDAMPDGGTIRIETLNTEIKPEDVLRHPRAQAGPCCVLRVVDEGCGIPEEYIERIFEPFFSTKPENLGTGLGLATVYGLAERNGGFVEVKSMVGKGSQFEVYLPEVVGTAAQTAQKVEPVPEVKAGVCVLVAEDDELIRAVTVRILEHAGHRVLVAVDGDEAVEVFDKHLQDIELAVLDMVMPKRSGKSVYSHIRKSSAKVPVLFTTGYSPVELEPLLEGDSAAALLHKPYRSAELISEIERMCKRPATR